MKQSGHAMKKNTVIFDLDGTLAIIDARRAKSLSNDKMDWDVFFDPENIQLDEPNLPVIKMAQLFAEDGFKIIISNYFLIINGGNIHIWNIFLHIEYGL